ncbi:hypothetical protein COJ09_29315 [Bacillus thuringiensis]|uniref:hypothetical protein n=1 Tax=Bacillus thuringiensis TaxID=1428 RepID=UPI000BFA651E|nr:hypothetical protein [Bacillus thuringiensis]PFK49388.1 hypothetical protein COJ09_29315 [Bacillus thuringiensis]
MAKEWTLQNAVKKFKPEKMKSLNKNNGNLNKREYESLFKEIECYYEEVRDKGIGKNRIIITDKKRKVKAKKEDKRQFNKGIAPPHSKHLALMVMRKMNDIDNKARTRKGWATYFGLISSAEKDIMNGVFSEKALKPYKQSMIGLGIIEDGEEKIFQDLAYTLTKVAKGQIQTVLNQAEKLKLISRICSWRGKVKGSDKPIEIDGFLAMEIKFIEEHLLKKHEISKTHSLMFKNCPKTKAFKAEWLQYIENVEDAEGDAMHLQYIYEVFRIDVLNKYAFDEYIKAHYPSEIDSFDLHENEQAYHSKLLDYVVDNAQKKYHNYLKKKHDKKFQLEEDVKELLIALGTSEEEIIASNEQRMEEEVYFKEKEKSPYIVLLESDKYVECIRNLHLQLHGMSVTESDGIKAVQKMIDEYERKELEQLGLSLPAKVEHEKSVKNGIRNYESCVNTEQHIELTKKVQNNQNQAFREVELENLAQQGNNIKAKPNIEPSKYYVEQEFYEYEKEFLEIGYCTEITDYEYLDVMQTIRDEIRVYEEKYGDDGMKHMTLDAVLGHGTRKVTAKEIIAEYEHQKQREHKEWEKQFEGGQPVKLERSTNNPLEVFHRIRYGQM